MSEVKSISPEEAVRLIDRGARLIDIREADECLTVIPGADHLPLSKVSPGAVDVEAGHPVIFHCRTGRRTSMNASHLQAAASMADVHLLEGGLDAWVAAGLPTQSS